MRLQIKYFCSEELLTDARQQFVKGGMLVRVLVQPAPELYSAASLKIDTPVGATTLAAQVVQVIQGVGVALAFDDKNRELLDLLRAADDTPFLGGTAVHSQPADFAKGTSQHPSLPSSPHAERAARIHQARHGSKDDRMRIIRGGDRSLHYFVVQNPGLGLDEVVSIAGSSHVGPEILQFIATRKEWADRREVAVALVRNARCPIPIALKMLAHVPDSELRRIAKTASARMPIVSAARKRLLQ